MQAFRDDEGVEIFKNSYNGSNPAHIVNNSC